MNHPVTMFRKQAVEAAQRVALLLIHALVKAEKTEMALKARGFQLHDVKKTQDKS